MRFVYFVLLLSGCSDLLRPHGGDLANVPYDEVDIIVTVTDDAGVSDTECDSAEICDTSG